MGSLRRVAVFVALAFALPNASAALLYWADDSWAVNRANDDGSNQQQLLNTSRPLGLAIDSDSNSLYYTDWNYRIWQSDLDGNNANLFLNTSQRPLDLSIGGGRVWWVDHGPVVDQGPVRSVLTDGSDEQAAAGENRARDVEYNDADGLAYYYRSYDNVLYSTDGSSRNWVRFLNGGAYAFTLRGASNEVYWANTGSIRLGSLTAGGDTTIVTGMRTITDLLVDEAQGYLYWAGNTYTDYGIWRADLDGGNAVHLIDTGAYTPQVLAMADSVGSTANVASPGTVVLFAFGGLGLALRSRRRKPAQRKV